MRYWLEFFPAECKLVLLNNHSVVNAMMVKINPNIKANKKPKADQAKKINWLWLASVIILTIIVYYPSINFKFTSWDDPLYVTENMEIRELNPSNILSFFSTVNPVAANYHPLTMISLAVDYSIAKLNPSQYHLSNLLLHILNTILVFVLSYRLSNSRLFTSVFVCALFSIHPMHIESVAWISERKDLLYVFFFLLALIYYLKYNRSNNHKYLIITFFLFVFAVLSKAMAVVFPLVLLLIDIYQGKKLSIRSFSEKIPFFIVSILAGILAIQVQSDKAIASFETFSLIQRISFGFYGYGMYIWKLIVPANLSSFYPYPLSGTEVAFPVSFYLPAGFGFIVFVLSALALFNKNFKVKTFAFGMNFFFITVMLVLQFISVGQTIMADRYTYLSYFGLLFFSGYYIEEFMKRNHSKKLITALCIAVILTYAFISSNRMEVWRNTETLWTDVIEKYPFPPWTVEIAYVGRGKYFATELKDLNRAFTDFKTLEAMNSKNSVVYSNLGNIYGTRAAELERSGDKTKSDELFRTSIDYYNKSVSLDSTISSHFLNRATAYIFMKNYSAAASDFTNALELDPSNSELLEKKAYSLFMSGKITESLEDYNKLIQLLPGKTYLYLYRGIAHFKLDEYSKAISDLNATISYEPGNGTAYYYLSLCYDALNDHRSASAHLEKAIIHGYKPL